MFSPGASSGTAGELLDGTLKNNGAGTYVDHSTRREATRPTSRLPRHSGQKPLIEKRRYKIRSGNLTWKVDEFLGDNAGLIIDVRDWHIALRFFFGTTLDRPEGVRSPCSVGLHDPRNQFRCRAENARLVQFADVNS